MSSNSMRLPKMTELAWISNYSCKRRCVGSGVTGEEGSEEVHDLMCYRDGRLEEKFIVLLCAVGIGYDPDDLLQIVSHTHTSTTLITPG